jgi:hypothetical protein
MLQKFADIFLLESCSEVHHILSMRYLMMFKCNKFDTVQSTEKGKIEEVRQLSAKFNVYQ